MERSAIASAAELDAVRLTADGLTVDDVQRLARGARLEIAPEIEERVNASRAVVERALEGDRLIYGLNTGLGSRRDRRVSREHLARYQVQMVLDPAGVVGEPLPDRDVRAMMAARAAGIARGGSGAHPGALHTLVAMLNAGVHPVVPAVGSVGASDLMHMAAIALVVMGRGQARLEGRAMPGGEALARAGIAPHELRPKDGLALISANGASVGLGALAVPVAERTAVLADLAGALTLEAIAGNPGPFDEEAVRAKPLPGQIAVAAHLRELLAGSHLLDPGVTRSVQDPLSFRVMPQVHGALRDQVAATRAAVEVELNAIDDSPLVSVRQDRLLSTGNFHPMGLALAFEALRIALGHVGMLSERRMNKLISVLYGEAGFGFGAEEPARYAVPGLVIYSAAALLSELKQLAAPVTLDCPPLDLDVEDHATLAPQAVMLARRALVVLETILAIEVLVAIEALDDQPRLPRLGRGTRPVYEAVRSTLDLLEPDASAATVVETVRRWLDASEPTSSEAWGGRYAATSTGRSSSA
jgi:histidine ammonia-lyase